MVFLAAFDQTLVDDGKCTTLLSPFILLHYVKSTLGFDIDHDNYNSNNTYHRIKLFQYIHFIGIVLQWVSFFTTLS